MLIVYHSNRLNILEILIESIIEHDSLDTPFESEIVLVQNMGVAQWLQTSLSKKLGIKANIEFQFLKSFIWKMFMLILPDIPQQSAFSKHSISWKLMTLLPDMFQLKAFFMLKEHCNDDNDKKKLFQLASHIADLYDQYLVYRPDWLIAWESSSLIEELSESQTWQALLWKALVDMTEKLGQSRLHYANLYNRLISSLESTVEPILGLPSRIFIFGISTLPPIYLSIFQALSKHLDIHILFTNPCRHYWGDIQDTRLLARLMKRQRRFYFVDNSVPLCKENENKANENFVRLFGEKGIQFSPNPLLVSWGKIGRDYIRMLFNISSSDKSDVDAFSAITPDSLLHKIQLDILNLENHAVTGITTVDFARSDMKRQLDPNDRSLTLHVCYSPQHEVEVLHDQLMIMLQNDPSLTPRDITVMVANIDSYSPFIQSVFGGATGNRYIPYTISDLRVDQSHPLIPTFISLLSLPESRFLSENVLALLDIRIVSDRFNIDEECLLHLRKWVNESGIRWGLDDYNVQEFALPVTGQHTWKFGLRRMLLGYAMKSNEDEWKAVLPHYDESGGLSAEMIGNLALLIMTLTRWHDRLKETRSLESWLPICREILNDFFLPDHETEIAMNLIEQQWKNIIIDGITSNYSEPISISLLRYELIRRLDQNRMNSCFLSEQVNICTMIPMRSIPSKVICLLGMNDGAYPKACAPLSFDLMGKSQRCGDHNQRDGDRYLFLETLISAQQALYISYIGHSIHDNSKRFPSVLVQELIDYVGQSHCLPGDEIFDCDESEQHVKAHITFYHSRIPFDKGNYQYDEQKNYMYNCPPTSKKKKTRQIDFVQTLKSLSIETITLQQLQHFWSHPVRAFFQQRLKVNFGYEENNIPSEEPFTLEGLNRYRLNEKLLDALVKKEDTHKLFQRYRAEGYLPYGAFGEIVWEEQCHEMEILARRIKKYLQPTQNIEVNLDCNGINLTGCLCQVNPEGLLRWQPSMLRFSQILRLWLEHLVYSAIGNEGNSRLFVRHGGWCFPPMVPKVAQNYLNLFLDGYLQGMRKPLMLPIESGGTWVKSCYDARNNTILTDDTSLKNAHKKFFEVYRGNTTTRGEGEDVWHQRLWRTFKPEYFGAFTEEAKTYLLPLFQFKEKNCKF